MVLKFRSSSAAQFCVPCRTLSSFFVLWCPIGTREKDEAHSTELYHIGISTVLFIITILAHFVKRCSGKSVP